MRYTTSGIAHSQAPYVTSKELRPRRFGVDLRTAFTDLPITSIWVFFFFFSSTSLLREVIGITTTVPVWVQESIPKCLAFTSTDLFADMLTLNAGLACTALAAPKISLRADSQSTSSVPSCGSSERASGSSVHYPLYQVIAWEVCGVGYRGLVPRTSTIF